MEDVLAPEPQLGRSEQARERASKQRVALSEPSYPLSRAAPVLMDPLAEMAQLESRWVTGVYSGMEGCAG